MNKIKRNINGFLNVRFLIMSVVVGVVVVFLYLFIFSSSSKDLTETTLIKQQEKKFILGSLNGKTNGISVSGVVKPVDSAVLASKMAGEIIKLSVNAGDKVKKGEVVAEVEHNGLNAQLKIAIAEYNRAIAEYDKQVAYNSTNKNQAEIALKKTEVSKISSTKIVNDNLAYTYRNALDSAKSSFSDAISSLVVLSKYRSKWQRYDNGGKISKTTDTQIKAAKFLLGADGTSALWDSSYLIALNGGAKRILEETNQDNINYTDIDTALSEIGTGLRELKTGFGYLQSVAILVGTGTDLSEIQLNIKNLNTAIVRITNAEKSISKSKILVNSNTQQQNVATLKAKQGVADVSLSETATIASAKSAVYSAIENVNAAKIALANAFIKAPFDGVVTEKFASFGDSVSPGAKIVSIASTRGWKAVFSAPDILNESVKIGDRVEVVINGVSGVFNAKITRIIPSTRSYSRRIVFEALMPNLPSVIRNGMVATARIFNNPTTQKDNTKTTIKTFIIPNSFIGYDYDGAYIVSDKNEIIKVNIVSRGINNSLVSADTLRVGTSIKHPFD